MTDVPSSSGARLSGDDYQHLFTLKHAWQLLTRPPRVTKIEIEARDAGNVDDLVVHRAGGVPIYHQVKFVMSQGELLTHEWFTTVPKDAKKSPLQRFKDSYDKLTKDGRPPEMALVTNRQPAGEDPLLAVLDGRNGKLAPRVNRVGPKSPANAALDDWAQHLDTSKDELLSLLESLEIQWERSSLDGLGELCGFCLEAAGLRGDTAAVLAAVGAIRRLIIDGVREVDPERFKEIIDALGLEARDPDAILVVQAIGHDDLAHIADASLDWVERFEGDRPSERRQLKDPPEWISVLQPQLVEATATVAKTGRRVRLGGHMRLSTAFMVGVELSERVGVDIVRRERGGVDWTAHGDASEFSVTTEIEQVGDGGDLVVALATNGDPRGDVRRYVADAVPSAGTMVTLFPASGPSNYAFTSAADVRGWARAVIGALRESWPETQPERVHIFQWNSLFGSLLLGRIWNRMPETVLYDDLGPGAGYTPTFVVAKS